MDWCYRWSAWLIVLINSIGINPSPIMPSYTHIVPGPLLGIGGLGVAGAGLNMMLQGPCSPGQCRVSIHHHRLDKKIYCF